MRSSIIVAMAAAVAALMTSGCAGPEQKLGRGIRNSVEFVRMGEMRRSIEQTLVFESPEAGMATGVIRGFNRSVARTVVGAYEIATFPLPSYDPIYKPVAPGYPDAYKPGRGATTLFDSDANLGFGGGEVFPLVPGSRFRIFDY
jgi:putative exosortase-associated protein (TIGR04073 family)